MVNVTMNCPPGQSGSHKIQLSTGATVTPNSSGQITVPRTEADFLMKQGFTLVTPPGALTDAAAITPDFSGSLVQALTLAGNRSLTAPIGLNPGQTAMVRIAQDATGNRTLTFDGSYKFSGGSKTLSTAANSIDLLKITCINAGEFLCNLDKAYA